MKEEIVKICSNKKIKYCAKGLLCVALIAVVLKAFFLDGLRPYYNERNYIIRNNVEMDALSADNSGSEMAVAFVSGGNVFSNLEIYFNEIPKMTDKITIKLQDSDGRLLLERSVSASDCLENSWNTIDINYNGLTRGKQYYIVLQPGGAVISSFGFQFMYQYLTVANFLFFGIKLLLILFLLSGLCMAIWNIELLYAAFAHTEKKKGFSYAIYFSLFLLSLFNPLDRLRTEVSEFTRIIGAGLNNNSDVAKRIYNFHFCFFLFAIFFVLFYLIVHYGKTIEKNSEKLKMDSYLDKTIALANVMLIFRCITYFSNEAAGNNIFYYSTYLLALIILMEIAFNLMNFDRVITVEVYLALILCGMAIAYPVAILSANEWEKGKLLLGIQAILFAFIGISVKLFAQMYKNKFLAPCVKAVAIMLSFFPIITSSYIELIHIMNQHGVFVARVKKYYGIASLLFFCLTALFVLLVHLKKWELNKWKNWSYPILVFGISCLSVQVPLQATYNADIIEGANSSILISDFLNFGTIPIVEHYGGHMLRSVLEGILYGWLNRDFTGAIFSPYYSYDLALLSVLFYFMMKYIWDDDMAFWTTLLIPFYGYWSYFGLGMLLCIAVIAYMKKNTYPKAFFIWLAFVWIALYRLDLGFAFGIAGIISLVIMCMADRNKKAGKQLLFSLLTIGIVGGGIWCILCMSKGINPVSRLLEFLKISLSNLNWAYAGSIGDEGKTVFSWSYLFVPLAVELSLLYTIFSKSFRSRAGNARWMLLLIWGFSYFCNFSRGLVRHSLREMNMPVVIWGAYIFLAVFLSCFQGKRRLFILAFSILMLCDTLFQRDNNFTSVSIADTAASRIGNYVDTWHLGRFAEEDAVEDIALDAEKVINLNTVYRQENGQILTAWEKIQKDRIRVKRVLWNASLEGQVNPYREIIDFLLEEEETFVDFMNRTFVYSAIGRKNPVYVSQSPLHLSGEFSQERFISEIKEANIPLVLMPAGDLNTRMSISVDGILNSYRYYKVSEYIYTSYRPLCRYGEISVWCLPERYDEMKQKLEAGTIDVDWEYEAIVLDANGNPTNNLLHNYSLDQLPVIWGEYDNKKAVKNYVISNLERIGDSYIFDGSAGIVNKQSGNYLYFTANYTGTDNNGYTKEDDETISATIQLGIYENDMFHEKYSYRLTLREGLHDYLIRVSSDYYWYNNNINAVKIICDSALYEVNMKVLEGD